MRLIEKQITIESVTRLFSKAIFAVVLGSISAAAQTPAAALKNNSSKAASSGGAKADPKQIFVELLRGYRAYPEFFNLISKGAATYDDVDPRVVLTLPDKVLQSRILQFNRDFVNYKNLEKLTHNQLDAKNNQLESIPLSDAKNRGQKELEAKALESRYKQVRKVVFLLSVDANDSMKDALMTLPAEKRVAKEDVQKSIPKLPFGTRETRQQWLTKKEIDKINLTPVADEFAQTQLGKKLIQDLGAPVDAWSYDDGKDELYVLVGKNISKVRVKEDSPGIRYIQTRVGARYDEPVGSDVKVDLLSAKGKFLTGDANQETLFGRRQQGKPTFTDELPPGHTANDGHDHSH